MKELKNKIQVFLQEVPQDKLLHFFYGSLIAFAITFFSTSVIAFMVVTLIAAAKELFDDKYSLTDVLFTILPAALILIITI